MNIFSTYKSMEDSAKLCPEGQNIKMLIRHSERQEIKKGASQEEIQSAQLTDNGRKMAICLGESLNMEIGIISSSYTQRCIDTCQEIINGYNKNHIEYNQPILKTEMLQSPQWNKNEGSDDKIWNKLGIRGIFDCFARNEYMPGFYDLKTSVNRIFSYLFETGNKNNTIDIYCTHDFQLAMILLFINGGNNEYNNILFNGNWPEMLEGMFLWRNRNDFNIIWRGKLKKYIMEKTNDDFTHVTADTTVSSIINNCAFNGFGQLIFPIKNCPDEYDPNMRIGNINSLLPYHRNINVNTTVDVINYLLDEVKYGKTIFYNFYSDTQRQNDKNKESTGLFFFKGNPGAPFAIICAGGGFSYVGSIHESFPYAIELSKKGYNAFTIEYRVGGGERAATEDLAAALSFIFRNAAELEVGINNYSVWGASAGAKMAANIGSNGIQAYGGDDVHKPSVVIMQYGHSDYTRNDPPTFAVVGEEDPFTSFMEQRINNLRNLGIDTEFHIYRNVSHGFGLGIGTSAEGWINNAIKFWEKHIK